MDAFEAGTRLRVYPVPRPGGEAVGLLLVPAESVADPVLADFVSHTAAALGFVHAERNEAPFGLRGAGAPPAPTPAAMDDPSRSSWARRFPCRTSRRRSSGCRRRARRSS